MIQINPVQVGWQKKEAVAITIKPINMVIFGKECNTYCELLNAENSVVDNCNIPIPEEIYSNWGTDDDIIVDYVLNEMKLTRKIE